MKRIIIFISLIFTISCVPKYKRINDIHSGTFLGFVEDSTKKMRLDITEIEDWHEFDEANGLNVISDIPVYGLYKIDFYEILEDNARGKVYNFYNLKEAEECKKEEFFWYVDDNKTVFKPITSENHNIIYYDAYYLIDYYDVEGEFEFSVKMVTEEKFNSIYLNN